MPANAANAAIEAWALRLLGEIAAQAGPPDLESAQARYGQALALADELGMRPLVAHCHLGLGKLYRRTGDRREGARSTWPPRRRCTARWA